MRIYDSSQRAKVDFEPLEPGHVRMYVCGPTVYDNVHIGNARTFFSFDIVRRWLMASGYKVTMAQNLTDVDDKIINRANEGGRTTEEVSAEFTQAFIDVMDRFGIMPPDIRPRATQEVDGMIDMISQLIDQGHAYQSGPDVYFSVKSDPDYGHVSNRDVEEQRAGARVATEDAKRDPLDFVLWKAAKPGEPTWDSPWGPGRPGWHTECAVMVHRYLGMPIDIHGGGSDLAFPHHENECAQAESCWGSVFANHWMHTGMLRVDGAKMSKSLGNFFTLKEVLDQYPADALRLLMLQTHYRNDLDFSFDRLRGAQANLERIRGTVANLNWAADQTAGAPEDSEAARALGAAVAKAREGFKASMDDDFNTAGALACVFDLVSAANVYLDLAGGQVGEAAVRQAAEAIVELLGVFGIDGRKQEPGEDLPHEVVDLAHQHGCQVGEDAEEAVKALLDLRADARTRRDWGLADAIRDGLQALGLVIEDTAGGARVHRS